MGGSSVPAACPPRNVVRGLGVGVGQESPAGSSSTLQAVQSGGPYGDSQKSPQKPYVDTCQGGEIMVGTALLTPSSPALDKPGGGRG